MPAIGHVTKSTDGKSFKGQLKTLSFRAPIDILPNTAKNGDNQPDYRVYSQTTEIGAGWVKKGKTSGEDYVSLSLADPAFGPKSSTPISVAPPDRMTRTCLPSSGIPPTDAATNRPARNCVRGTLE